MTPANTNASHAMMEKRGRGGAVDAPGPAAAAAASAASGSPPSTGAGGSGRPRRTARSAYFSWRLAMRISILASRSAAAGSPWAAASRAW